MKKVLKSVIIALAFVFTFATGVYANEAYQEWKGSQDYRETSENLNLLSDSFTSLFNEKEELISENNALDSKVDVLTEEKERLENEKTALVTEKEKIATELTNSNNSLAEKDSVIAEKDKLLVEANAKLDKVNLIYGQAKTHLVQLINDTNSANGKGNRYDILSVKANELAKFMGVNERINSKVGNGQKSDELKQAEKDMADLKEKSDALVEEVNGKK